MVARNTKQTKNTTATTRQAAKPASKSSATKKAVAKPSVKKTTNTTRSIAKKTTVKTSPKNTKANTVKTSSKATITTKKTSSTRNTTVTKQASKKTSTPASKTATNKVKTKKSTQTSSKTTPKNNVSKSSSKKTTSKTTATNTKNTRTTSHTSTTKTTNKTNKPVPRSTAKTSTTGIKSKEESQIRMNKTKTSTTKNSSKQAASTKLSTKTKEASEQKKIKGPGSKATTFKKVQLEGEALEKAIKAAQEAEDKPRSQTKEEQQKKKTAFNYVRVSLFEDYMNGSSPFIREMNISNKKDQLLTDKEQEKLAKLIQASIPASILMANIKALKGEHYHLRSTISKEEQQILSILKEEGYIPSRVAKNRRQMKKMERIIDEGTDARNIFAEKNVRLVKLIANKRKRTSSAAQNVDLDDLVAEGMNGLMVAIDYFNPVMGNKFSTPAAWWIDQPIRNYLDSKTKTIHMPTHMNNIYKSIHYATRALQLQYNDDAEITDERLAEYIQSTGRDITVEKIKEAHKLRRETISYDLPVDDESNNGKTIAEMLASDENHAESIVKQLSSRDIFNRLLSLIEDDKKREILRDWYSTEEIRDIVILSNVSRKHCLTKERVRQLKNEAENELKNKISSLSRQENIQLQEQIF